jgi:hypothetical protein
MVYMYSAMLFGILNDMTAYSTCYNIVVSRNSLSHVGSRLHPLEIKSERKREHICSLIFFIFFSTHCSYPHPFILVVFVCRCYLTRSAILAFVHLLPCCAVHLILGRCCCLLVVVFALNKSFLLFKSAIIDDL